MGTVNGCTHRRTHHHGTVDAYQTCGCRCGACRTAARAYRKRCAAHVSESRRIPAQPVRDRLRALHAAGVTDAAIAHACGYANPNTVRNMRADRRDTILKATADRIMALPSPALIGHPSGDDAGVMRRVQALRALGWSTTQIAAAAHLDSGTVQRASCGVTAYTRTTSRLLAAYELLAYRTPPSGWRADRVRRESAARGYVPPMAWESDAAMDDPDATPLPRGEWFRYHDRDGRRARDRARQEKAA